MAEAVVIVPGLGGCELYTQPTFFGFGPPSKIWLDYAVIAGFGWRLLGLNDNLTPDVPGQGVIVPGGPLPHYYGTLTQHCQRLGYRTWGASLEWRGPIVYDAQRLADQVLPLARDYSQVHLIGHSRGGLVIRAALPLIQAAGQHGRIGQIITLGTPHYGSWAAAGMLSGWEQTCFGVGLITGAIGHYTGLGHVTGTIRDVMDTWPGAYEMLPSPQAPGITAAELAWLYSESTWTSAGVRIRTRHLTAAQAYWPTLPIPSSYFNVTCVCGYGGLTPVTAVGGGPITSTRSFQYSGDGDGVVPLPWATLPARPTVMVPTAHSALTWDGRVLDVISGVLASGPPVSQTIGGSYVQPGILG